MLLLHIDVHVVVVVLSSLLDTTIDQQLGLALLPQSLLAHDRVDILVWRDGLASLHGLELLANKMLSLGNSSAILCPLLFAGKLAGQATLREDTFSALSDLFDTLHGLEGRLDEVAVVLDGDIASLGELAEQEGRIDDHLLSVKSTVSLGPLELAWLSLHLEVLVAF